MSSINADDLELSFSTQRLVSGADVDDTPGLVFWSVLVELVALDDGPEQRRRIGHARAVVVETAECPDPWDACDAASGDLHAIATAVWDREGELSPAVQEVVEYLGGDVLLLDRIELDHDVRGHDVGLLCTAEIIRVLGRGCDVVATEAMPPMTENMTELERRRGRDALAKHWRRLGLRPIPGHEADGMLVGDLSRVDVAEARELIRGEHGLG